MTRHILYPPRKRWYESRWLNLYLLIAIVVSSFYFGWAMEVVKFKIYCAEQ